MNKLLAIGLLVTLSFILTQGSLLVIEEGTMGGDDWRQLTVELPPAVSDLDGNLIWGRPIWMRQEGQADPMTFAVLGSLICDESVEYSVAALIDGEWICVDINNPVLLPDNGTAVRDDRQVVEYIAPPGCPFYGDNAPLVYMTAEGGWNCTDPVYSVIQYVHLDNRRPICNDTDLVVYDEDNNWFVCQALDTISFRSTVSRVDNRWQVPSTVRHIGGMAPTGSVRTGSYLNFRWSEYVFSASSATIAFDQNSPPQIVTSGDADWVCYTASTSFVTISGTNPYRTTVFNPIWPGAPTSYARNLTSSLGTTIAGSSLILQPSTVFFNQGGSATVSPVSDPFTLNAGTAAATLGQVVVTLSGVKVLANYYPVVEIGAATDWRIGSTTQFTANLHLTLAMWLRYSAPSGF